MSFAALKTKLQKSVLKALYIKGLSSGTHQAANKELPGACQRGDQMIGLQYIYNWSNKIQTHWCWKNNHFFASHNPVLEILMQVLNAMQLSATQCLWSQLLLLLCSAPHVICRKLCQEQEEFQPCLQNHTRTVSMPYLSDKDTLWNISAKLKSLFLQPKLRTRCTSIFQDFISRYVHRKEILEDPKETNK